MDTEWKFSRSRLYMEFIKEGSTLPIPLNIIPTGYGFYSLFKYVLRVFIEESDDDQNDDLGMKTGVFLIYEFNLHFIFD